MVLFASMLSVALLAEPVTEPITTPLGTTSAPVVTPVSDAIRLRAWHNKRRDLLVGLGVSVAAIAGGIAAIVVGRYRAQVQCRGGSFCEGTPYFVGIVVGAPLIAVGGGASLGIGIALGVHGGRRPTPTLSMAPTALSLRF